MDYTILVNKDNPVSRAHIPNNRVPAESKYKDNIYIDKKVKESFDKLKKDALKRGYERLLFCLMIDCLPCISFLA